MSKHNSVDTWNGLAYWRESVRLTVESWGEMFAGKTFAQNLIAGLTIALVALPLNLALAIACGLPPAVGLVTGAVAGAFSALFGGSRLQVTGPEVALAPLTLVIVTEHGFAGLLVITFLAGFFQIAFGVLRLGRLISLMPVPVIGGFMAAVGILVFDSQIPRLLGLPAEVTSLRGIDDLSVFTRANPGVALLGLVVVACVVIAPRIARRLPGPLVGLVVAVAMAALLPLQAPMVDSVSSSFPLPALPDFSGMNLVVLLPEALTLALLASIDSLLCAASVEAKVGGPRSRSDQELVAQGLANMVSSLFGGMPVAAAVVRSMAAIEAQATSRLAPFAQSIALGLVVVFLGSSVTAVPLVALAGILLVVGYRLIDWRSLTRLWKLDRYEAGVFIATAAGILFTDFVAGVGLGVVAALAHFAHRQGSTLRAEEAAHELETQDTVGVLKLTGPLFFADRSRLDEWLSKVIDHSKVVIDVAGVTTMDASGVATLRSALERLTGTGCQVWLSGVNQEDISWMEDELAHLNESAPIVVSHHEEAVRQASVAPKQTEEGVGWDSTTPNTLPPRPTFKDITAGASLSTSSKSSAERRPVLPFSPETSRNS